MSVDIYPRLTPNMIKFIQSEIEEQVWIEPELTNFFEINNLIRQIPEGLLTYETTMWEKLPVGRVSADASNLPDSIPAFKTQLTKLALFGIKVVIPYTVLDAFKNNPLHEGGDLMARTINQQLNPLRNQTEQFLAYGDDTLNAFYNDDFNGAGVFKGIFNGGKVFGAGDGGEDGMVANGDLIATIATATTNLKKAALKKPKYMMFSDPTTYQKMQQGNHYSGTPMKTEKDTALEREDVAGWIDSVNFFAGSAPTTSKILITTPTTRRGRPAYRLIRGYDYKIIPLNGGYPNGKLQYETGIISSMALEFLFQDAVQVSGALNFVA